MKVIFIEDFFLYKTCDVLFLSKGFVRNFLIPKFKVLFLDKKSFKIITFLKKVIILNDLKKKEFFKKLYSKFNKKNIYIKSKYLFFKKNKVYFFLKKMGFLYYNYNIIFIKYNFNNSNNIYFKINLYNNICIKFCVVFI